MKKILLISNMYPSKKFKHYGVFVKNVEKLLKENDYYVDKVVMKKQTNFLFKLINYIFFHLKVIIKGLFGNYDYLYVHFISHSSLGAIIVKKIKKKTKIIFNAHGNDVVKDTENEEKNIKRSKRYLKYRDKVVVPSNYFKKIICKQYEIPGKDVFIYPSGGVNTNLFVHKNMKESKKNTKLNVNYNYIGYVSRIEKDKGWDTFVKMIKELNDLNLIKQYKLRFLIVGTGEEEEKMHNLIDNLSLEKYIDIRDMVSQEELVDIYNSLELFVFSTYRKSDSLGLVGLEAMSSETFVIASNNYGPSDYMLDKINGLTFIPEDYKDLSLKIKEYFEMDDKEKEKIKKEARKTALKYDIENTKKNILEVFK